MPLAALVLRAAPGWAHAAAFERRSACMAALVLRCMRGFDAGPITGLEVLAAPEDAAVGVEGAWARVPRAFDGERWARAEDRTQRALVVALACAGVEAAGQALGWPGGLGDLARERVISRGYQNEQRWRKPSPGPGGRAAQLLWVHGPERIELLVELLDRRGRAQARLPVCRLEPDEAALAPLLGRLRWAGPTELILEGREGGTRWRVPVPAPG